MPALVLDSFITALHTHSLALHTDVMCFSFNTFHLLFPTFRKPKHEDAELECALALWETLYIETQTPLTFDLCHKLTCHLIRMKRCRVG